jgi:hypothetical protein
MSEDAPWAEIHGLGVVHVSPQEKLRQRVASRREVLRQATARSLIG